MSKIKKENDAVCGIKSDVKKKNPYKYDFRFMDNLTETKDLKKSIKINIGILVGFLVLFVVGLVCGLIYIPPNGRIAFVVLMSILGLIEIFPYTLCIRAIMRATKKIKENESKFNDSI